MKKLCVALIALSLPGAATAGEIAGNGKLIEVRGASMCAFSGLNDTPEGDFIEVAPGFFIQIDPGGKIQNYGKWLADGWYDSPSDPANRNFLHPSVGCNPQRGN